MKRFLLICSILAATFTPRQAAGVPTQEDVFKSIQNNVNDSPEGSSPLPFILAGGAVVILLALFTQRQKRENTPKALNHQGKLAKEVLKLLPLKSAEIRQLKLLTDHYRPGDDAPLSSPLTLLLCPSVLAKAIQKRPAKCDRKVIITLARKAGNYRSGDSGCVGEVTQETGTMARPVVAVLPGIQRGAGKYFFKPPSPPAATGK